MSNTKLIRINKIVTTAGTQVRASIDEPTVAQYADAMTDAANKFPPVVIYHDGNQFIILADGFHRVMAASRNDFTDIEAIVIKGTKADALKFALGANAAHGLRRSNADKRHSVDLALAELPKISDREIARICAVHHELVANQRKAQLEESSSSTRVGADGKERKLPKKPAKAPEPEQPKKPLWLGYVNRCGGLVVKPHSMDEQLEAMESPSVFQVVAGIEADTQPEAESIARDRVAKQEVIFTRAWDQAKQLAKPNLSGAPAKTKTPKPTVGPDGKGGEAQVAPLKAERPAQSIEAEAPPQTDTGLQKVIDLVGNVLESLKDIEDGFLPTDDPPDLDGLADTLVLAALRLRAIKKEQSK